MGRRKSPPLLHVHPFLGAPLTSSAPEARVRAGVSWWRRMVGFGGAKVTHADARGNALRPARSPSDSGWAGRSLAGNEE